MKEPPQKKTLDWFDWAEDRIRQTKSDRERLKKLYSGRARRVVREAISEAEAEKCGYIGAEHLLLAMVKGVDTDLRIVPDELRLDEAALRAVILSERGPAKPVQAGQKVEFSPRFSRVIAYSRKEAAAREITMVEPEHLLLALLGESEGLVAGILKRCGVDRERALAALSRACTVSGNAD